jgi:hypothetical protein
VLELNAPEGTVTEPSTVTTVPNGKLRASAIEIVLGFDGLGAAGGVALPVAGSARLLITASASSSADSKNLRLLFLWIMIFSP